MQEITISKHFVNAVLLKAKEQGHDVQRLLQRAQITPKLISQPNARVSAEQFARLQTITMRAMKDEMLGYTHRALPLGSWTAMFHWLIDSKNLGQAITRFCHYHDFLEKGFRCKASNDNGSLCIEISDWEAGHKNEPYAYELFLYSLHRLFCWLVADNIQIQKIVFPYSRPEHFEEYPRIFPKASLVFDGASCQIRFDSQVRRYKVMQNHETLLEFERDPLLHIIINDYNQQSWVSRTQAALIENLHLAPTLVDVAELLNIHHKKLYRELKEEGISYGELKTQVRRDIAIQYLTKTNNSIEEIAALVGFSEASAFTRAFRQWTELTPFNYRKLSSKAHH